MAVSLEVAPRETHPMRISDLLVAKHLISAEDVETALERQASAGGPLTDSLLALDLISISDLDGALHDAPAAPASPAETGLSSNSLMKLLVKTIYAHRTESIAEMRAALQLPSPVITQLLKDGVEQKLLEEYVPASSSAGNDPNYRPSHIGKNFAEEALEQNRYVGAAPVTLEAYRDQAARQAITKEFVTPEKVGQAFSDMVISEAFLRRLGPALNSGKSMLLYGPPGNGKSTIAEKIGVIYESVIFVPYAIEVGGEIITVYDPAIHKRIEDDVSLSSGSSVRREEVDSRWVPCRRPLVITGGELTLEMLDLKFNEIANFYEAPLHMKAQGGVFIVDDFGRQLVQPEELLNRWIIPLERRVDFLKLHTGKQFEIPFDQLTIFSTNLSPDDLMDPAFLRRIPYKIEVSGPTEAEFAEIFGLVCKAKGLAYQDGDLQHVIEILSRVDGFQELACYQGKFIADQIIDSCKYARRDPGFDPILVEDAVANIFAKPSRAPEPAEHASVAQAN